MGDQRRWPSSALLELQQHSRSSQPAHHSVVHAAKLSTVLGARDEALDGSRVRKVADHGEHWELVVVGKLGLQGLELSSLHVGDGDARDAGTDEGADRGGAVLI